MVWVGEREHVQGGYQEDLTHGGNAALVWIILQVVHIINFIWNF